MRNQKVHIIISKATFSKRSSGRFANNFYRKFKDIFTIHANEHFLIGKLRMQITMKRSAENPQCAATGTIRSEIDSVNTSGGHFSQNNRTGAIAEKVKKPLEGIKVACYYGCLMSRPADIMQFDDAENPMAMDNIMTALGAEVVPFPLKTECCGAAMGIPRRDITARLTGRILERAQAFGADAVVVACPLCHMNLDLRQRQAVGGSMKMPVLYFTQLMGLALGLPHQELGFEKLCVSPDELLRKIDAAQAAKAAAAKADEATEEAKA